MTCVHVTSELCGRTSSAMRASVPPNERRRVRRRSRSPSGGPPASRHNRAIIGSMSVLIIGGGICGLGTALLLARDGHDVTVLERDADPLPDSPQDAWRSWERKGVAQFRQPHNFMPGLRLLLEAELPDVQE